MLHLSFDTKKSTVDVEGVVTKATVAGYVDATRAMDILKGGLANELAFGLDAAGFVKDENKNIWRKSFAGTAKCSEEDAYNERVGRDIATCRAKVKAYRSFLNAIDPILRKTRVFNDIFGDYINAKIILEDEEWGLENAIETGWCDGKRR